MSSRLFCYRTGCSAFILFKKPGETGRRRAWLIRAFYLRGSAPSLDCSHLPVAFQWG